MSELPCGCICAPRQTLADCPLGFAAVGPGAISSNPWPGSVICDAFPDYAPTRWKHNDFGYLYYPTVSGGPLVTNSWQSDVVTVGGRTYYDVLTIAGKDVGEVTLDRYYIGHPDPLFPAVVTWRNVRHLDEFNGIASITGNARALNKIYVIRLQLGDPLAAGFEEDYLPYASWIGDIPCTVVLRTHVTEETTPICGSDYAYANLAVEYDYTLTGPYTTFTSSDGVTSSGTVTATPTFSETRHVSFSAAVPFASYGVTVPIWATGTVFATSSADIEDVYFQTNRSFDAMVEGFVPTTHPNFFSDRTAPSWFTINQSQADHQISGSAFLQIRLMRTTGQIICRMNGSAFALNAQHSSGGSPSVTLTSPQNDSWFDTVQTKTYPDSDFVYATLAYYGAYSGGSRPGGSYRCTITNFQARMDGAS